MSWDKLSLRERAEYIKTGVKNGITDINEIKETYNDFIKEASEDKHQENTQTAAVIRTSDDSSLDAWNDRPRISDYPIPSNEANYDNNVKSSNRYDVGGYMQAGATAMNLASNAIGQANNVTDITGAIRGVNAKGSQFGANHQYADFDSLNNAYRNFSVMNTVSGDDLRNNNFFADFGNSLSASAQGASAGQGIGGPIGAAVGGIVGGVSSVIGSIFGRAKANRQADTLNGVIADANRRQQLDFNNQRNNIAMEQANTLLANYSALGGSLNKFQEGGNLYGEGSLMTQEGNNNPSTFLGLAGEDWADVGTSMIPIYGTYKDAKEFYNNPSWGNAGMLGLSLVSEVPLLKWAKAVALGGKATSAATKAAAKVAEAEAKLAKAQKRAASLKRTINKNPVKVKAAQNARGAAYREAQIAKKELKDITRKQFSPQTKLGFNLLQTTVDANANYLQGLNNNYGIW